MYVWLQKCSHAEAEVPKTFTRQHLTVGISLSGEKVVEKNGLHKRVLLDCRSFEIVTVGHFVTNTYTHTTQYANTHTYVRKAATRDIATSRNIGGLHDGTPDMMERRINSL